MDGCEKACKCWKYEIRTEFFLEKSLVKRELERTNPVPFIEQRRCLVFNLRVFAPDGDAIPDSQSMLTDKKSRKWAIIRYKQGRRYAIGTPLIPPICLDDMTFP
jgi:hypothetical protein